MSRVCSICGKGQTSGNNVSHSHRKTRRTFKANVQKVSYVKDGKVTNDYATANRLRATFAQDALKATKWNAFNQNKTTVRTPFGYGRFFFSER